MELLIKIGSKYHERYNARHRSGWRDGQIIDIRDDGSFAGGMERKHHCVIELPNMNYWSIRGSRDWKSTGQSVLNLKKYLSVTNQHGTYCWQNQADYFQPKDLKREWFVDLQWLLNQSYISLSDYESCYDKSRNHNRIVLTNVHDFTSILKNENIHTRLNPTKDFIRGSVSSGTYQIGTGMGADYATVSSFEADIAAGLTGDLTGEHQSQETAIDSAIYFETVGNGNKITLTAQLGCEHNGATGNGARINYGSGNVLIGIDDNNLGEVEISKLAIDASGKDNKGLFLNGAGDSLIKINRVLISCDSNSYAGIYENGLSNVQMTNNIIYGCSSADRAGIYFKYNGTKTVCNNTVVKCYNNIQQWGTGSIGTLIFKNNLTQGNNGGADFVNSGLGWGTNGCNISEDNSSPNADYRNKDLYSNSVFIGYGSNDYQLSHNGDVTNLNILKKGEDLSDLFRDDIIWKYRSSWYIGAYELSPYKFLQDDVNYDDGEVIECLIEAGIRRENAHYEYYKGLDNNKYTLPEQEDEMENRIFSKSEIKNVIDGIKSLEGLY